VIPYEDSLLDVVQEEIASCHSIDTPGGPRYYEAAYRAEERFYWFPVLDWIRHFKSVKRVVDIGVAYGTLLLYTIKYHQPEYALAVDALNAFSPTLLKRYDIQYLNQDIERSAFESCEQCDLVIFTETLEHLNFNPIPTLTKLRRMLSQDGHLILTTPDAVEWGRVTKYYPSLDAIPPYTGQNAEWIDGHVWQYTREEVESLMPGAGLEVVKFAYARGVNGRHLCFLLRRSN
jgi:SAM-dependent methyltransferase